MAEPFLGQICIFPYMYAPRGWTECVGQSLSVSQYSALYALLGNNYGGNQSSFKLPNMAGRFPLGFGPSNPIAASGGSSAITITKNQMPSHNHSVAAQTTLTATSPGSATLNAGSDSGNVTTPKDNNLASGTAIFRNNPRTMVNMAANSIQVTDPTYDVNTTVSLGNTGGGAPIPMMPPFLTLRFCIALTGLFPSRN